MKLLTWLMETFVNTFGITRPKPEQERAASLAIGGFLLGFIVLILSITTFLVWQIHSGSAHPR